MGYLEAAHKGADGEFMVHEVLVERRDQAAVEYEAREGGAQQHGAHHRLHPRQRLRSRHAILKILLLSFFFPDSSRY